MAILAGHAAGNGTANGSSSPVPDLRIDSPASPLQNGRSHFSNGFKKKVKNGVNNTPSPDDPEIGGRIVTFAVTPETPEIRLISARPPKRTLIQRSVSAFVPSTSNRNGGGEIGPANGNPAGSGKKFASKLLRSHSAATTTALNPATVASTSSSSDLPQSESFTNFHCDNSKKLDRYIENIYSYLQNDVAFLKCRNISFASEIESRSPQLRSQLGTDSLRRRHRLRRLQLPPRRPQHLRLRRRRLHHRLREPRRWPASSTLDLVLHLCVPPLPHD